MKSYTYSATECGLKTLPPGTLRLAGFEHTGNPKEADVYIVPCDIRHLTNAQIHALPYLKRNETRHALFCISDQPTRTLGIPAIIFRADCNTTIMRGDPTTVSWPWPVNPKRDIDGFVEAPKEGFQRDVCFVGWDSTPLNKVVCESVSKNKYLSSFIQLNHEFYGTWETRDEKEKLVHYRGLFLRMLHDSRLSLCVRSIAVGVVRYRFYEAMAMGRIPVHFNDGAFLPFQDKIDWEKCSIQFPEESAHTAGTWIRNWLDRHSDEEILERGRYGRLMWETWLCGEKWDDLFGLVARARLERAVWD